MLSKLTLFVTASFALLAIANPFPKLPPQASPSTGKPGVDDAVPYSSYTSLPPLPTKWQPSGWEYDDDGDRRDWIPTSVIPDLGPEPTDWAGDINPLDDVVWHKGLPDVLVGLPFSSPRVGGLATSQWAPSLPTSAVDDGAQGSVTISSAIPTPSAVDGSTTCDVGSMTMCCDSLDDMSIGWGCSPLDATMKCVNTTACCYLPEEPSETEPTALICYSDDIVVNK